MKQNAIIDKAPRKSGFRRHAKHRHQLTADGEQELVIEQFYDWLSRHGHRAVQAPGLAVRD